MKKSFRTQCVLRTVLSEDKNGAYTKQERCIHKVRTVLTGYKYCSQTR